MSARTRRTDSRRRIESCSGALRLSTEPSHSRSPSLRRGRSAGSIHAQTTTSVSDWTPTCRARSLTSGLSGSV